MRRSVISSSLRSYRVASIALGVAILISVPLASAQDQAFTSLQPCVAFDTRPSQGGTGQMTANEVRTFHVVGSTSNFAGQGGVAGGCGVPGFGNLGTPQVRAVLINLVAIQATGGGNLKAWATDQAETGGGVVNYQALSPSMNNSNAVVAEVRQDSEGNDISIRANGSAVQVRGVVLGYFTEQPVEYNQIFVNLVTPEESQCDRWVNFLAGIAGETFSRITLYSSEGVAVSCGNPTQVANIVTALTTPIATSITCDGNNWTTDDNCTSIGFDVGSVDVDATSTTPCSCLSDLSIRPCINNENWGGNGCPPPSQNLVLRLER